MKTKTKAKQKKNPNKRIGEKKDTPVTGKLLVIAPHGVPQDDEHTDIIATKLAWDLDAAFAVNNVCPKSQTDLGMTNDPTDPIRDTFLKKITFFKKGIIDEHGSALVVLIHGIDDNNMKSTADENTHVLIGIGQADPNKPKQKDRLTLDYSSTGYLIDCLAKNKLTAKLAPGGSGYCGWDNRRLNQMFNDKTQKSFYDSRVRSVQLEIRRKGFRETPEQAKTTAQLLDKAFTEFLTTEPKQPQMPKAVLVPKDVPVNKVKMKDIVVGQPGDGQFAFRVTSDDPDVKKLREEEIKELAGSIQQNGLVNPLTLIRNSDGKYRILCGYRRFEAVKLLGWKEVEAKVYDKKDLTPEQCFLISLAENKDRKNWTPLEIGQFLQSAKDALSLADKELAMRFGEPLGIGTSHTSVNKHIKLNKMRTQGKSPEIINDVIKRKVPFGVATDGLVFIKSHDDRNALYSQIVKPMKTTRPELTDIKKCLDELGNGNGLKSTLARKDVKEAIEIANESGQRSQEFIRLLKLLADDPLTKQKQGFEEAVEALRTKFYGANATKEDFDIVAPADMEKNEVSAQFKLTPKDLESATEKAQQVLKDQQLKQLLDTIESP